jgi:hypothetical protein
MSDDKIPTSYFYDGREVTREECARLVARNEASKRRELVLAGRRAKRVAAHSRPAAPPDRAS